MEAFGLDLGLLKPILILAMFFGRSENDIVSRKSNK